MHRDARGWMHDGGIAPLTFPKGATGTKVPFYNSIIGNFMVDQDRPETILLQLFGHSEKSEWFSAIFVVIFEVNIVDKRNKHNL